VHEAREGAAHEMDGEATGSHPLNAKSASAPSTNDIENTQLCFINYLIERTVR